MSLADLKHITVSDFGGPWTRLEASDVPVNQSLLSYNAEYNPGLVQTRKGFTAYWNPNEPMGSIFNWVKTVGNYAVFYNTISGNVRMYWLTNDGTNPAGTSFTLFTQAGAAGASVAQDGTRLLITTFDSTGLGLGQARVLGQYVSAWNVDKAFLGPLTTKPTLTNSGVGNVGAGTRRVGYIIETRNGFLGKISPLSATTNLFDTTSTITCTGGQQIFFALTATWPTEAYRVWPVMTTVANLDRYFIVENATPIDVVGGGTSTIYITLDVSDADLSDYTDVTDNQSLFTQDLSGNGPFNPFSVGTYGQRATYLTEISGISQAYVSEPDNAQKITADQHVVYLPGWRSMKSQGEIGRVWYVLGPDWTYAFEDTGDVPSTWPTARLVDGAIGTQSPRGFTVNASTGFAWTAHTSGLYLFQGGAYGTRPVSYYVDPDWKRINWSGGAATVQVVDNKDKQQVYVIAPLDSATTPSHILVFDYTNGLSPEAVKYSLWYLSGYNPGAGAIFQNPTTLLQELWLGNSVAGPVLRQMNSKDATPYNDNGAAIDFQFETALLPGVNLDLGRIYLHQARQIRAIGSGSLNCTAYGMDRVLSQVTPAITLSSSPGTVYTNRYPMVRSESISYRFTQNVANSWVHLSSVDHYYGVGPSWRK